MVVNSLKSCWSKFSTRIRDYYWDAVDSYRLEVEQPNHSTDGKKQASKTLPSTSNSNSPRNRHNHHHNHKHSHNKHRHHNCIRSTPSSSAVVGDQNKSPNNNNNQQPLSAIQINQRLRQFSPPTNNNSNYVAYTSPHANAKYPTPSVPITKNPTNLPLSRRVLPRGYCKKVTPQGQVFFCDPNGRKYWYDPSVPKELISATINLDALIGELSSNWEIRRTEAGKTYFVNHIKKTTQFTDPRLVAYKDYLWQLHKETLTVSKQLRRTHFTPNNDSRAGVVTKITNNCIDNNTLRLSHSKGYTCRVNRSDSNGSRHRCPAAHRHCEHFNPFVDNMIFEDQSTAAQTPSANTSTNNSNYQANLISGSHHNLSAATNDTIATNHSNTLTGLPPSWFFQTVATEVRNKSRPNSNNVASSNQLNPTSATLPSSIRQSFKVARQQQSANNNATNDQQIIRNNKELFDKISILRQELLKQQVVGHPCRIDINRKRIFEDSFRVISHMPAMDLKKRLLVKFKGEEGLDYGGVAREWFYLLSREMLNPIHGLFQYTSNDIYNLQINPDSGIVYREHLSYLHFCGRVMGMAVFHGHFIEGHFTLPFYKMLLRKPITLDDIEMVDPELYRSLCWILENDITNVIDTTFLVQHNALGQLQEHELKEGGRSLVVTEENKHEYVSLYVNYRCRRGIEYQFDALQRGFYEILMPHLVDHFNENELELLIGGLSKIDVDDWRVHTKLKNCTVETPLVKWFWDIVKSYGEDKRARLLQFVTGSPRVPIQGFKALQGVNSELRLFTIHLVKSTSTDNLPKSHTCFNRIDLPPYESYEKLRDKLTQAIEETMGFAIQ